VSARTKRQFRYHKTDPVRLKQVLANLISNAIKFTHEGSITFGYVVNNNMLEFFVRDTGIGIAPEQKDMIFQRFMQADVSITRTYGGTGLGLAISRALVELLEARYGLSPYPAKDHVSISPFPMLWPAMQIMLN